MVFNEAENYRVLKAAQIVLEEGIAEPILLGDASRIQALNEEFSLGLEDVQIIDVKSFHVPRIAGVRGRILQMASTQGRRL